MSKPILEVEITTPDAKKTFVKAVFDTGAHPSIIREDALPPGCAVLPRPFPMELRTAGQGGKLRITGSTVLQLGIGDRLVESDVLISPDLVSAMLVGAGTMQRWEISVIDENGHTTVRVGHDMRDPDITEVD